MGDSDSYQARSREGRGTLGPYRSQVVREGFFDRSQLYEFVLAQSFAEYSSRLHQNSNKLLRQFGQLSPEIQRALAGAVHDQLSRWLQLSPKSDHRANKWIALVRDRAHFGSPSACTDDFEDLAAFLRPGRFAVTERIRADLASNALIRAEGARRYLPSQLSLPLVIPPFSTNEWQKAFTNSTAQFRTVSSASLGRNEATEAKPSSLQLVTSNRQSLDDERVLEAQFLAHFAAAMQTRFDATLREAIEAALKPGAQQQDFSLRLYDLCKHDEEHYLRCLFQNFVAAKFGEDVACHTLTRLLSEKYYATSPRITPIQPRNPGSKDTYFLWVRIESG